MPSVSVCIITWNEKDQIAGAIENARLVADEVIVADTGSTDGTVALAVELADNVILACDRYHKAESRNAAMDAATGDWVVILDCDEVIADPVGLRIFLEDTDATAVYIKLAYVDADGKPTLSYDQMRCWKRGSYQYKYRAHEVPTPVNGWGKLAHTELVWEHRPPAGREWKLEYTRKRLELDVAENPGAARPLYYLGRLHTNAGEWEDGKQRLEGYIELAPDGFDRGDAWFHLARCCGGLGDEKERIRCLYMAIAAKPLRRDFWGALASRYYQTENYAVAAAVLKALLALPEPGSLNYVTASWWGAHPYDLLARCLYKLAEYEEGREYADIACQMDPDNVRLVKNRLWFDLHLGDPDAPYLLYGADIHSGCKRHEAIAALVNGPRVLDVGCGSGDLLMLLHDEYDVTGTDISEVALQQAFERGVKADLFCTADVPGDAFNTIIFSQVLEHLDDDAAMIGQAATQLADDGRIIVSVPRNGRIPSPGHKREYTEESVKELLEPVGNVSICSWEGESNRILAMVRV